MTSTVIFSNDPKKPRDGWYRFVSGPPDPREPIAHSASSPLKIITPRIEGGQAWAVIEGRDTEDQPEHTIAVLTADVATMMVRLPAQFRVILADADPEASVEVVIGGKCTPVDKARRAINPAAQPRLAQSFKAAHRTAAATKLNNSSKTPRTSGASSRARRQPGRAGNTDTAIKSPYISKEVATS